MLRSLALWVVLPALLLSFVVAGLCSEEGPLVLAVARFDDRSNSGLANVGEGVADLLLERLLNAGYRVVERQEIESIVLEQGLNPLLAGDVAQAAALVGADLLLIGSVTKVDIRESSFSLGFITVSGATVDVSLSLRAVSAYTSEILGATSVQAQAEGQTGFSLNIGQLMTTLAAQQTDVCGGGFRTNKSSYVQGEIVNFGHSPTPAGNYSVAVYNASNNLVWSDTFWNGTPGSCITRSWNQTNVFTANPVPPGNYTAYLCTFPPPPPFFGPPPNQVAPPRSFSITAGTPPAWMSEITVGTQAFNETIVGQAVDAALDKLMDETTTMLEQVEAQVLAQRTQGQVEDTQDGLEGRVVDVFADGTVVLDIGSEHGVETYDVFEVFDAIEVRDPDTDELIQVIPASDQPKGEIIVARVERLVSLATKIGQAFEVAVGDIAIQKEP